MNLKLVTRHWGSPLMSYRRRLMVALILSGVLQPLQAGDVDQTAVIRIGVENNSPPLSFKDGEGRAQGFTSDLLIEMEKTGLVRFEIVPNYWSFVLKKFNEGELDALANVIETEERRKTMSYSIPHVSLHGISYTRPGEKLVTSTSQFAGKSIAMVLGTMSYLNAQNNDGWGAEIVGFDGWEKVLLAVKNGQCDFALLTRPLKFEQPDEMGLQSAFVEDVHHRFHLVVQPGNARGLEQINAALAEVRLSGEFERIYAKWIGPIEPHPIRLIDLRPHLPWIILVLVILAGVFLNNARVNSRLRQQAEALKLSDERRRREAEFLELTGTLAKVGGWELDLASNEFSWTKEVYRITGLDPTFTPALEDAINLCSPEVRPRISKLVQEAIATGKPYDLQLPLITKQGHEVWVHTQGFAEMKAGKAIRLYGTFQDITERREVELELASIHERYMELVDSTDGIVWEADAETFNFTFVSGNAERMLGYPLQDWLQPGFWSEHLHPENRDRVVKHCASHTQMAEDHSLEYRFCAADGRVVWMRDQVVVLSENGKPRFLRGLMVDISETKKIQVALEQREAQFRSIFEGSPIGIAIFDSKNQRMLRVNSQYAAIAGRSMEDLLGTDWSSMENPEELPFDRELVDRLQSGERASGQLDKPYRRPDGSDVWINVTIAPTASDDPAQPWHLCMIKDITLRKKAELDLHESEERLRRAVLHSPIPLMIHAEDGEVLQISDSWCRISGYSADELRTVGDWVQRAYGEVRAPVDTEIRTLYALTENRAEGDFKILTSAGQPRIWDFYSAPLGKLPDARRLVISMAIDVTERRATEGELQESLTEKEALLKEVHHRIKNNLQVITSLLRLETNKQASGEAKAALSDMQGRIRSMALLHEALYRTGDYARVNLAVYLRQLTSELFRGQNTAPERVRLEMNLSEVFVELDQAIPCGLIVNELLTNALKHGFPGTHAGEVALTVAPTANGLVKLVVDDSGVGVPEGFEIGQTDSLGLQLVTDLTRQLQGTLTLKRGARFEICFKTAGPQSDHGKSKPPSSHEN